MKETNKKNNKKIEIPAQMLGHQEERSLMVLWASGGYWEVREGLGRPPKSRGSGIIWDCVE